MIVVNKKGGKGARGNVSTEKGEGEREKLYVAGKIFLECEVYFSEEKI